MTFLISIERAEKYEWQYIFASIPCCVPQRYIGEKDRCNDYRSQQQEIQPIDICDSTVHFRIILREWVCSFVSSAERLFPNHFLLQGFEYANDITQTDPDLTVNLHISMTFHRFPRYLILYPFPRWLIFVGHGWFCCLLPRSPQRGQTLGNNNACAVKATTVPISRFDLAGKAMREGQFPVLNEHFISLAARFHL